MTTEKSRFLRFTRMILSFSHGISRRVTDFYSCHELSNLRIIVFTRKVAENHGRAFPVPRLFYGHEFARLVIGHELSRLVLGPTDQLEVIIEFQSHGLSRRSRKTKIRKFDNSGQRTSRGTRKIKFDNSKIRDKKDKIR